MQVWNLLGPRVRMDPGRTHPVTALEALNLRILIHLRFTEIGYVLKPWSGLGSELLKLFSHGVFLVGSPMGSRA